MRAPARRASTRPSRGRAARRAATVGSFSSKRRRRRACRKLFSALTSAPRSRARGPRAAFARVAARSTRNRDRTPRCVLCSGARQRRTPMKRTWWLGIAVLAAYGTAACESGAPPPAPTPPPSSTTSGDGATQVAALGAAGANARMLVAQGEKIFRIETFRDEAIWGGQLRLHAAIAQLCPKDALALGLKVDVDALTAAQRSAIASGNIDLGDPAVTAALLKQKAVIGVTGFFDNKGALKSVGIQCSLCHTTVDTSLAQGIGHRLDGVATRDLDIGKVIASAPN